MAAAAGAARIPGRRVGRERASGDAWLPIRRAAELLGVSVATLRLWTAAGRVQASVTPGGHRRYAEADVRRLLAEQPGAAWDEAAAELVATLRARYAQLAREEVRTAGLVLELRRRRAAARTRPRRGAADAGGRVPGRARAPASAGRCCAAAGASAPATARKWRAWGSRRARRWRRSCSSGGPVLDSVSAMARAHPGLALPAGEALAALTRFMDVVLLAMTRTYERHAARRGAR